MLVYVSVCWCMLVYVSVCKFTRTYNTLEVIHPWSRDMKPPKKKPKNILMEDSSTDQVDLAPH